MRLKNSAYPFLQCKMAFLRTFWDQILLFFLTYMLPNIFFLKDICMNNTKEAKNWQKKIGSKITLPPPNKPLWLDGLTNGARGILVAVEKKDGKIKRLAIKFHNPRHGESTREKDPCWQDKDATYIYPVAWQYQRGGNICNILQFPVKGAAAITGHKIQVRDAHFIL